MPQETRLVLQIQLEGRGDGSLRLHNQAQGGLHGAAPLKVQPEKLRLLSKGAPTGDVSRESGLTLSHCLSYITADIFSIALKPKKVQNIKVAVLCCSALC